MRGAEHDRLWNQLEAEIHLHRHKTVIRACRGRLKSGSVNGNCLEDESYKNGKGIGKVRHVKLVKESNEGLGISITGGREHGVPILISEIHPGQPAERCGELSIGDTILAVNGISLKNVKHNDAVRVLSKEVIDFFYLLNLYSFLFRWLKIVSSCWKLCLLLLIRIGNNLWIFKSFCGDYF